ncbi:hypothetical protein JB92DRAFT_2665301, partial [Gautieria morchelliformis]
TFSLTAMMPRTNVSQCNTSPQCCNFVAPYNNPAITSMTSKLGVVVSAVDATVGMFCAPISVLAAGG